MIPTHVSSSTNPATIQLEVPGNLEERTKPSRYLSEGRNAGREEDEDKEDKEGIDGMTEQERQTTIGEKWREDKGMQRLTFIIFKIRIKISWS